MALRFAEEMMRRFERSLNPELAVVASRYFLSAGKSRDSIRALGAAVERKKGRSSIGVVLSSPFYDSGSGLSFDFLNRLGDPARESHWLEALERHSSKMPTLLQRVHKLPPFVKTLQEGQQKIGHRMEALSQADPNVIILLAAAPILQRYGKWLVEHSDAGLEHRELELDRISTEELKRAGGSGGWNLAELQKWSRMTRDALFDVSLRAQELHDAVIPPDMAAFHEAGRPYRTKRAYYAVVRLMQDQRIPKADARYLADYLLLGHNNMGWSQLVHARYLTGFGEKR